MTTNPECPCLVCTLERALDGSVCDGTLIVTDGWCRANGANWIARWVQKRGGLCDCEVLMNAFGDDIMVVRGVQLRCQAALDAEQLASGW